MTTDTPTATIARLPPTPDLGGIEVDPWLTPAADLVATLLDRLAERRPGPPVIPTGIVAVDDPDGGLPAGSLTAICGPPGADRTTILFAAALHAAERDHPVVVYVLGGTAARATSRLAAAASGLPERRLRRGSTDADLAELVAAQRHLADLALEVVAGQTVSAHDIRAGTLLRDDPPELIAVDNLTLLAHGGRASDLKHLAVDLNVAALCSVTVAPGPCGAAPRGIDIDLLAAADTLVWADAGQPPVVLFAAGVETTMSGLDIREPTP